MKSAPSILTFMALAFLLCTEAEATRMSRDFSGDAMQRHDSRMMGSPLSRIPSLLGMSFWPFYPYYYAPPSLTIVNVEIHLPPLDQPPATFPAPTSPARPKFWTNRCGVFVEIEVSSTTNLIQEEEKPC